MEFVLCDDRSQIFDRSGNSNTPKEYDSRILYFPEKKIQDEHSEAVDRTARNVKNTAIEVFTEDHIYANDLINPSDK